MVRDRPGVERVHRVLVVGGDEHHVRQLADALGHLEPGQARHADIEEHDLRLVLEEPVPRVVAVLRHQRHLRLDYLLKPVQADRFERAVARIGEKLAARPADLSDLLHHLKAALPETRHDKIKWLKASIGKQIRLIDVDEVLFFQSDTKYTRVVLREYEALVRTPLKDLLSGLDRERFWQVHRNTVVNVNAIAAAERVDAERMQILLRGCEEKLAVSRTFAHLFRD